MNKKLLKNVAIMNVKKNKLKNLKKVFLTFCMLIGVSTTLLAQSLIDNGDFSQGAGITYRWSHKNDESKAAYSDVGGAFQAVISADITNWYTTGIRNSKQTSLSDGDMVRVKFSAQTLDTNTQLRLALDSSAGRVTKDIDLISGVGFNEYIFDIEITSEPTSNYKFWLKFLDAGTFKVDDIEVDILHTSDNLALDGTSFTSALAEGTDSSLNDGVLTAKSGVRLSPVPNTYADIEWTSSQTINKVTIYGNSVVNQTMTSYTIQYLNEGSYVDILDVNGVVTYPVTSTFGTINTTRLRIVPMSGKYRIDEIEAYNETTLATENNFVQEEDNFLVYSKSNSIVISGNVSIKQLQIFSLVGTLVYEAENITENGNIEIATDSLPKGIYIVRINSQYTQKIIVQ